MVERAGMVKAQRSELVRCRNRVIPDPAEGFYEVDVGNGVEHRQARRKDRVVVDC